MKLGHILFVAAAAVLPQFAQADTRELDIGAMQGMLGFCSHLDPKDDKRFDEQAKRLTAGLSEQKIDEIKRTSDYKQAYQLLGTVLKELPQSEALPACVAVANQPTGNPKPVPPDSSSRK
jgi:hypothetical protein